MELPILSGMIEKGFACAHAFMTKRVRHLMQLIFCPDIEQPSGCIIEMQIINKLTTLIRILYLEALNSE
jgi:hypothetical protein